MIGWSLEQEEGRHGENTVKVKDCYKEIHSPTNTVNRDNGWKEVSKVKESMRINLYLWSDMWKQSLGNYLLSNLFNSNWEEYSCFEGL